QALHCYPVSLANCPRRCPPIRPRSQRLDYRVRWHPHHHGSPPQEAPRGRRAVSPRECIDGTGQESDLKLSSSLTSAPAEIKGKLKRDVIPNTLQAREGPYDAFVVA